MKRKNLFSILAALVLLAGCAGGGISTRQKAEETVAARAQARWDLLIEGRLESAYEYLSPGYRQVTPFPHYRNSVKGVGLWKTAQIRQVECEAETCEVQVDLTMQIQLPRMRSPARTQSVVVERWIKGADGVWGYLPKIK